VTVDVSTNAGKRKSQALAAYSEAMLQLVSTGHSVVMPLLL
jgi:hypothetical protein